MIVTHPFEISGKTYFRIMFWLALPKWIGVILMFPFLMWLAFYLNPDFIYVLLIVLFLVLPNILFFQYWKYATDPHNRYVLLEKEIEIKPEGVLCHFTRGDIWLLPYDQIVAVRKKRNHVLLYISNAKFIAIPVAAFLSVDDQDCLLRSIQAAIKTPPVDKSTTC